MEGDVAACSSSTNISTQRIQLKTYIFVFESLCTYANGMLCRTVKSQVRKHTNTGCQSVVGNNPTRIHTHTHIHTLERPRTLSQKYNHNILNQGMRHQHRIGINFLSHLPPTPTSTSTPTPTRNYTAIFPTILSHQLRALTTLHLTFKALQ